MRGSVPEPTLTAQLFRALEFRFDPATFWSNETFPQMDHTALYPDAQDPLFELAEAVRAAAGVCD
jgi:hypothetical protein